MSREFIGRWSVTPASGSTVHLDVPIPPAHGRWSVHYVPKNTAASPDPITVTVEYEVEGAWYPRNPGTSGTALINTDNVVTGEDVVGKVRLAILFGATVPDEDGVVELWAFRDR
jgi:hypothetical protein